MSHPAIYWLGYALEYAFILLLASGTVAFRLLAWGLGAGFFPAPNKSSNSKMGKLKEGGAVAVIGGGIAGVGAAYALAKSGYAVTIFEAEKVLGGSAKTFLWQTKGGDEGTSIRTGLSGK